MQADKISEQRLLEKIRQLVPEQMVLVENFIDSLYQQNTEDNLTLAALKLSEPVLQKIWDNPDDAEYDEL
ncbi:MAG: toxin-antitoxin system, antitoxin component, Xre family protein [Gloeotrichia echinulata GP01]